MRDETLVLSTAKKGREYCKESIRVMRPRKEELLAVKNEETGKLDLINIET